MDIKIYEKSFNPCFNGFTTLTDALKSVNDKIEDVSILVLMDSLL